MLRFIITLLLCAAFIGWIFFNIHSKETENQQQKRRNKTSNNFNINDLPQDMPAAQKNFLHKVSNFTGSDCVTPYNIRTFLANSTAKDFAKIPGWEKWTTDYHLKVGQEERQRRALYSDVMHIISFDETTGKARVHGESGQDYNVDGNGCSCQDFQVRKLPCKPANKCQAFFLKRLRNFSTEK